MTIVIVERLRTCRMMTISMAAIITGKILTSASLALSDSSMLPPISMRYPTGSEAISGCRAFMTCLRDLGRLCRLVDVRADRDDWRAVAAFHDRFFEPDFGVADLIERNLAAIAAHQREVGQPRRIEAVFAGAARDDRHVADILANLRDRNAGEQQLQLLRGLGRRQADQIETILVGNEAKHGRAVAPVAVRLPHVGNAFA